MIYFLPPLRPFHKDNHYEEDDSADNDDDLYSPKAGFLFGSFGVDEWLCPDGPTTTHS